MVKSRSSSANFCARRAASVPRKQSPITQRRFRKSSSHIPPSHLRFSMCTVTCWPIPAGLVSTSRRSVRTVPRRTSLTRAIHRPSGHRVAPFGDATLPWNEKVRVLLAHEAASRYAVLDKYRRDVWVVLLGGSVLMGLLGYGIAKRSLTPVKSIGQHISRIEAHNLGERLDIGGSPLELHDIAVPVNRMLNRLERAFTRLSQFSSDLAHDMRTSLANIISSSQITLSSERTTEEYEALIDSNIEECERLQRMIETMLFLARVDHAKEPLKLSELDCAGEFARLTSYFEAIADNKGIRFFVDGAMQVCAIRPCSAVSNLVSNALEYANRRVRDERWSDHPAGAYRQDLRSLLPHQCRAAGVGKEHGPWPCGCQISHGAASRQGRRGERSRRYNLYAPFPLRNRGDGATESSRRRRWAACWIGALGASAGCVMVHDLRQNPFPLATESCDRCVILKMSKMTSSGHSGISDVYTK